MGPDSSFPDVPAEAPLPSVVTRFAPWRVFSRMSRTKRWILCVLVPLLVYIELPVFFVPLLEKRSIPGLPAYLSGGIMKSFWPLKWCFDNIPGVQSFYTIQFEIIDYVLTNLFGI